MHVLPLDDDITPLRGINAFNYPVSVSPKEPYPDSPEAILGTVDC